MSIPNKFYVLEMANNHMGNVNHGIKIIKEFAKVTKKYPFNFGFKLQYRDLDTFIHKNLKNRDDIKYIKRFKETKLKENDLKKIISTIKKNKFVPVCTPFDEKSVDKIVKHNFEIIKIASCSFTDWPLIEKIASANKPVIASTAGATLEDIEKVVMSKMGLNEQDISKKYRNTLTLQHRSDILNSAFKEGRLTLGPVANRRFERTFHSIKMN